MESGGERAVCVCVCVCVWVCWCAQAGWVILEDMVWFSRTTFFFWVAASLLSVLFPPSSPDWLRTKPRSTVTSSLMPPPSILPSSLSSPLSLSVFSLSPCEILPYPILSLRPLSPGVAGEIRGYNFPQSAESGPQRPAPLPSCPSATLASPHPLPSLTLPPLRFSHESPPWPGAEEHQHSQ